MLLAGPFKLQVYVKVSVLVLAAFDAPCIPQDHTLVNSTRFSEVAPDMEMRLHGLLNLPNAAQRHLYELPHIQVCINVEMLNGCMHFDHSAHQDHFRTIQDHSALHQPSMQLRHCSNLRSKFDAIADVDEAEAGGAGLPEPRSRRL